VSATRRGAWQGIAGGATLIAVVTILARVAGFARWAVFSPAVGSTAVGSAYTAANALPNVLFEVAAGGALAGAVVPLLAGRLATGKQEEAGRIGACLLTWALTVLVPLAAVLALAAGPISRALLDASVEAAHPGTRELARQLIVIFAVQVPLYGVGVIAGGVLQAAKRFFWPAFAPVLSSLTVMATYWWYASLAGAAAPGTVPAAAVRVLGWGTTTGVALLTLPLVIPAARRGLGLKPQWRFPPGVARQAMGLAGAGLGALLAQQLFVVTVVWLAGNHGEAGTLPLYHYAQAVYLLPYAVLAVPLATAAFPHLSAAAHAKDWPAVERATAATTRVMLACAALGSGLLYAAAPAVEAAFGSIDRSRDVAGLGAALSWFAPGLIGYALMAHLQRVLYAAGRPRPAVAGAAAGWLLAALAGAGLALAGPPAHTVVGIAQGTCLGMLVGGAWLLVATWRSLGRAALAAVAWTGLIALAGSAAGATLGRLVADALLGEAEVGGWTGLWRALGSGVVAAAVVAAALAAVVAAFDRGLIKALRPGRQVAT
jgi:putative peptidoglycan lipid II flippase